MDDDCQLLTVKQVASPLAISSRNVWRMSASGQLPRPLHLGEKTVRWRLRDIRSYLADLGKREARRVFP
jgi:predicted DNA-binding transcriptional regulator AlpA